MNCHEKKFITVNSIFLPQILRPVFAAMSSLLSPEYAA
jgi:hypothetical protein